MIVFFQIRNYSLFDSPPPPLPLHSHSRRRTLPSPRPPQYTSLSTPGTSRPRARTSPPRATRHPPSAASRNLLSVARVPGHQDAPSRREATSSRCRAAGARVDPRRADTHDRAGRGGAAAENFCRRSGPPGGTPSPPVTHRAVTHRAVTHRPFRPRRRDGAIRPAHGLRGPAPTILSLRTYANAAVPRVSASSRGPTRMERRARRRQTWPTPSPFPNAPCGRRAGCAPRTDLTDRVRTSTPRRRARSSGRARRRTRTFGDDPAEPP